MGHTYTKLMYHCVFSTKERRPLLSAAVAPRLAEVVGGIVRKHDGKLLAMNGPTDHVHLLAILAAKYSVSDQLRDIKAGSSKWIHRVYANLQDFAWQGGYGAFSVSKSTAPEVIRYIARQREHHRKMTFQEEFIAFLKKHEIEYDPKYVFE